VSVLLIIVLIVAHLLGVGRSANEDDLTTGEYRDCPITKPNGQAPPGVDPSPNFHGNGAIFIAVPEDGIERALHDPRGYGGYDKLIFYRLPIGAVLTIMVSPYGDRREDEPAEVTRSPGQEQSVIQVSGVWFPVEGCWVTTAHTAESSLTVVEYVVFEPPIEATPAV
jgi:hypothetical protein